MADTSIPRFSPTSQLAQALGAGNALKPQATAPALSALDGINCAWSGGISPQVAALMANIKRFDPHQPPEQIAAEAGAALPGNAEARGLTVSN